MSHLTVTPYLTDYTTAKAARESWNAGKDWVINDFFNPYDGEPINKEQAAESGYTITLRFARLHKVAKP